MYSQRLLKPRMPMHCALIVGIIIWCGATTLGLPVFLFMFYYQESIPISAPSFNASSVILLPDFYTFYNQLIRNVTNFKNAESANELFGDSLVGLQEANEDLHLTDVGENLQMQEKNETRTRTLCSDALTENWNGYSVFCISIQYVCPIIVLLFTHFLIWRRIKRLKRQNPPLKVLQRLSKGSYLYRHGAVDDLRTSVERVRQRRSKFLLLSVVITFAIAWLPLNITNFFFDHFPKFLNDSFLVKLDEISYFCILIASNLNPVYYGWFNEKFRLVFLESVCIISRGIGTNNPQNARNEIKAGPETTYWTGKEDFSQERHRGNLENTHRRKHRRNKETQQKQNGLELQESEKIFGSNTNQGNESFLNADKETNKSQSFTRETSSITPLEHYTH